MKKTLKFLTWLFVFGVLYSALITRNASFDVVYADTEVAYTGTLSQFLTQEKNSVNTTLETVYQRVYTKFHASGLNLMKTLNYQSLVCLGVLKRDDSLINQMQKDRQELKLSFLKDFLDIEAEIATLEEKNRIQWETSISLFAYGTSYESEKARIAQKIEQTKSLHLGFVRNFESTHTQKLEDFINNVLSYTRENTGVVTFVNDKLRKMQNIEESFSVLESWVNQINTLLIGWGTDFLASAQTIRTGSMNALGAKIQPLIDAAVKKYKRFTTLSAVLMNEKEFAMRNYGLDFDEKMNTIMNDRYNKKEYEDVKAQITKLKADFMSGWQLSCPKIYAAPVAFENRINALLGKINVAMSWIDTWLQAAKNSYSPQEMKNRLFAWFTEFNKLNLNKKVTAFRKIIRDRVWEAWQAQSSSGASASTSTSNVINTYVWNKAPTFTRPFRTREVGTAVKNLQIVLKNNGYYDGEINGIYTNKTIEWVYQFQLKNWLLVGYEKRPATRWWMWPATRAKLNELAAMQ